MSEEPLLKSFTAGSRHAIDEANTSSETERYSHTRGKVAKEAAFKRQSSQLFQLGVILHILDQGARLVPLVADLIHELAEKDVHNLVIQGRLVLGLLIRIGKQVNTRQERRQVGQLFGAQDAMWQGV